MIIIIIIINFTVMLYTLSAITTDLTVTSKKFYSLLPLVILLRRHVTKVLLTDRTGDNKEPVPS